MIIKIWKEQDLELVSELPKQVKEVIKENVQILDVLFQCLLMDQMDWEEGKLYVQFSTIYLLAG